MGEVLIKAEGVSKKFAKDLKKSLYYGLTDVFNGITRSKQEKSLRKDEFWAVKDVSFEVRRGECLGLIGHNGAGKSTLLKILNGLIAPDEGTITMKGKIGALIELGAGFNPILTGRENIYNNAAIIGFSKTEIKAKFDTIVTFAELEEFIDMPVQNYSSGMKVRLGFAIASQMEPDILIIDEVLAVGDISFRAKCYTRISELMRKCCVILVTHSMPQVSKICTSAILLNKGTIKVKGSNAKVIEGYYEANFVEDKRSDILSNGVKLNYLQSNDNIFEGEINKLQLDLSLTCVNVYNDLSLNIFIMSQELIPICQFNSNFNESVFNLTKGDNFMNCVLNNIYLNTGIYTFSITIEDNNNKDVLLWVQNLNQICVKNKYTLGSPIIIKGEILC